MLGPLPRIEHLPVGEEVRKFGAGDRGMRRVIAGEQQARGVTTTRGPARDGEHEVALPQVATEAFQRYRIEIGSRRLLFLAPGAMAIGKIAWGLGIEADRVLQDRGADPFRREL